MSKRRANQLIGAAETVANLGTNVPTIYPGGDWECTGCARKEFGSSERHVFRLLDAAKTEKNITDQLVSSKPIPERHLRPLANLGPEQQKKVWQEAVETAPIDLSLSGHILRSCVHPTAGACSLLKLR
jgi:hypothetical protein